MVRASFVWLIVFLSGCSDLPPSAETERYCNVTTAEPCLDQVMTGNCVPCPH